MFILRPVREKFSDLNRSAVRKRLPTPGIDGINIISVSRRLSKKFDLKSYNSGVKPRLTSAMQKKRLSLANKHLYYIVEKWETVLFSDKSIVQQFLVRKRHVQILK